jgi:hypothetical protein
MSFAVDPDSISMSLTTRPTPIILAEGQKGELVFTSTDIRIDGAAALTGTGNPAGWTLGMIQVQWVETNWVYYRGRADGDGSIFFQLGKPPARPCQGCRDTLGVPAVFYDALPGQDKTTLTSNTPLPAVMSAVLWDEPSMPYPLTFNNNRTRQPNFLYEAMAEWHFCTVLSLRDPHGTYTHLRHMYWNLHWHVRMTPTDFTNTRRPWTVTQIGGTAGNAANVGHALEGGPVDDIRFRSLLTAPGVPNCNRLGWKAYGSAIGKESNRWQNFDVRR